MGAKYDFFLEKMRLKDAAQRGGNGILLADCSDLGISYGELTNAIGWTDPADVVLNGATLAQWKKTVCVRKAGGYPENAEDGDIVCFTERNHATYYKDYYRDNTFSDTGLEAGVTYYYKLFTQTVDGNWNNLDGNKYKPFTAMSYTMLASFIAAGHGRDVLSLGDAIQGDAGHPIHSEYTDLYFRVEAFDKHTPKDSTKTHSVTLGAANLLPFTTQYDAPESYASITQDTTANASKSYYIKGTFTELVEGTDWNPGDTETADHIGVASCYEAITPGKKFYAYTTDAAFVTGKTYYKGNLTGNNYTKLIDGTDYNAGDSIPDTAPYWYERNPFTDRASYGNNCWRDSNLRQWLNSSGLANQWFTKKTLWDVCTSSLSGKNGFARNLDANLKSACIEVRLNSSVYNSTADGDGNTFDKFFVNSQPELFSGGLDYYAGEYNTNARRIRYVGSTSSADTHWLRSAFTGNALSVYHVQASGASINHYANSAYRVAPACVLG